MQSFCEEYIKILKEELVPALGCTEPIAIAYGAAKARATLGQMPERMVVRCSGNIVKNVKAVVVPHTGNLRGIETSAILGVVGGNPEKNLEVLENVSQADIEKTKQLLQEDFCCVELLEGISALQIIVEVFAGEEQALVEIAFSHTNIVRIEKNHNCIEQRIMDSESSVHTDRSLLNLKDIYYFAKEADISMLAEILDRQVSYNERIALDGLSHTYGANVGGTLLNAYGKDIHVLARALPAAGSDARMNGCVFPVVINSGSGNQGMTVSLPVVAYARHLKVSHETMHRALALSNLIAIYQKNNLGKLSAFCGAVSAAAGSAAGIAFLHGEDYEVILDTITNTLANVSGIVCDGAKSSCAAKIASAVDAGILAFEMAKQKRVFQPGEGLVKDTAEETLKSIGRMGRDGMRSTDVEILRIMLKD